MNRTTIALLLTSLWGTAHGQFAAQATTVAPQPLRFASVNNYYNYTGPSAGGPVAVPAAHPVAVSGLIQRSTDSFASGNLSEIRLSFNDWNMTSASVGPTASPNGYTVVGCAIEYKNGSNAATTIAVTFAGSASIAITAGQSDVQSDPLYATQFGRNYFAQDDQFWKRCQYSFTAGATDVFPTGAASYQVSGTNESLFIPDNITLTNGILGTGSLVLTNKAMPVSAITFSGTTANATFSAATELSSGSSYTTAGATGADATDYNGSHVITVDSPTTFHYTMGGTPAGNATGTLTLTANGGVAAVGTTAMAVPIVLGRHLGKTAKVFLLAGDSKTMGGGSPQLTDSTTGIYAFNRVLLPNASSFSNGIAGLNLGMHSGTATQWTSGTTALITNYLKYANYGVERYGTNDQVSVTTNFQAIWNLMYAAGYSMVVRTSLSPRTTLADAFTLSTSPNVTSSGTTATATATAGNIATMTSGDTYTVSGLTPSAYNGSYVVTNATSTTFTYTFAGGTSPATGTGAITSAWRNEPGQVTFSGWSSGGTIGTFETNLQALVGPKLTYFSTDASRGSTHWVWKTDGATAFLETSEGLHESAQGYEDDVGGNGTLKQNSGTTTSTLRAYLQTLP